LAAPEVRMSADHPGAGMAEVRGPTRTKVSGPETDEKLAPGAPEVRVPGPTKGSRLTSVKVAWLKSAEEMKKMEINFFI